MNEDKTYSLIFKLTNDFLFLQAYKADPDNLLTNEGFTDQTQVTVLKNVLSPYILSFEQNREIQNRQAEEMQEHYDVVSELRNGLNKTIRQMLEGYQKTMVMYTVSFYIGVFLILIAVIIGIIDGTSIISIAFAGFGTVDIVTHFISNPPLKLQKSRADLAQLQAAYFTWYQDYRHWASYLTDEYYMRYKAGLVNPELAQKASADYKKTLQKVSDVMLENTKRILAVIEEFVEKELIQKSVTKE